MLTLEILARKFDQLVALVTRDMKKFETLAAQQEQRIAALEAALSQLGGHSVGPNPVVGTHPLTGVPVTAKDLDPNTPEGRKLKMLMQFSDSEAP